MIMTTTQYTALLLDADDTLLDFRAAEHAALGALFHRMGFELDDATRELYAAVNRQLWAEYERGEIDRERLTGTRFGVLFEKLGRDVDGVAIDAAYREELGQQHQLVEGALEVCGKLRGRFRLYIVSNGVYTTQVPRLRDSGLAAQMDGVFISERVGHAKPSPLFFDHVMSEIGIERGKALIVGDSLASDIRGGSGAGIDTCWFNPTASPRDENIKPTYEIASLDELLSLLLPDAALRTDRSGSPCGLR